VGMGWPQSSYGLTTWTEPMIDPLKCINEFYLQCAECTTVVFPMIIES